MDDARAHAVSAYVSPVSALGARGAARVRLGQRRRRGATARGFKKKCSRDARDAPRARDARSLAEERVIASGRATE